MLTLGLLPTHIAPLNVLCFGAHADDIEIGCGGSILAMLQGHPSVRVRWVVFSATPDREREARDSASAFLENAGSSDVAVHDFRDGFFPSQHADLKEAFEATKDSFEPHLIFTHHRDDHHQDHRTVAELTWNTFRDHTILGYEVLKYDPDLGNPNLHVALSERDALRKADLLLRHFASQRRRRWFTAETFHGLMRVRGVQAASPSGLAEAFYAPKLRLELPVR